ncbi:COX15/CtaA family protein [Ktedonobacter robiniae]|uniref:Heme A synthase n=1 Tax=Ktedonobacter robiniae TaxID=2778365 RepID=A0ABQ3UZD6_9CHLR|nr:heme A synthase [Ktedonobacter robiniae]GHO58023.1 heme A synthase [Ktedonobacter robiniae]
MTLRLMKILAVLTSIGAYIMVLMGAIVTKTGAGQGCGTSWPICKGQLIPAYMSVDSVLEYSHRIASGIDGFLILFLTVWSWWVFRHNGRVKLLGFMSLFFVILQGALGAVTVMYEGTFAEEWILSLHFGFALISFASVILLTIYLFQMKAGKAVEKREERKPGLVSKSMQYVVWGITAYCYIVVYTGALVRHSSSTLGCGTQWPGCSTLVPDLASHPGVQMFHRYAATLIGLLIVGLLIWVLRRYRERRDLVRGAWLALIMVILQGAAGMLTVVTGGQLVVELLHTTLIAVLFAVLSFLCMQVGWPWKARQPVEQVQMASSRG